MFLLTFLHFLLLNQIVLGQKSINTKSCQGSQTPTCNLVCFGDFENINQAKWDELSDFDISDLTAGWQATGMVQTPDLLFGINFGSVFGGFSPASDPSLVCSTTNGIVQNPTGHFAHIVDGDKKREGFALPLKEELVEEKKYRISLNFYTGCNNQLNILLAKNMPCNHTISSFNGFPNDNKTALQKVDCGKGNTFIPLQTIFHTVLGMTKWQTYSTDITLPQGSDPVAFVIFYAHFNDAKKATSIYYDNITITEIPDAPVITPTVITQCLPGEIEIDYDVSINNSIETDYGINLTLQSLKQGVTLNTQKGDFTQGFTNVTFTKPNGGVKTVKLFLKVAANASPNQTILLDVATSTDCVDLLPQTIPANIVLITSSPDFTLNNDCTKLSMAAVTQKIGFSNSWKVTPKSSPAVVIGTATGSSATITVNSTGVFTVTHTLVTPCGTFTAAKDITVSCTVPLCPCSNNFNIGNDKNSITYIKNSPFYSTNKLELKNSCFSLQGTLIIDENYSFGNVEMRMGEDAKIIVKSGKILTVSDKSYLYSCSKMWKGIDLESGSNLDFRNNTIEDALYAITLHNNDIINIKDNTFRKNWTGIYFPGVISSDHIYFYDTDGLTGNTFTCENTTLIAPKQGEKPLVGIWLENCQFRVGPVVGFTIGLPTNFFNELYVGVAAKTSNVAVAKADFKNMGSVINGLYYGHGVVATQNTTITVKNCNFQNMAEAINSNSSWQRIDESNTFTNTGNAIFCDKPIYFDIENNQITNTTQGIYIIGNITDPAIPSIIKNNNINFSNAYFLGIRRGIVTSGVITPVDKSLTMRDNIIYDTDLSINENANLIELGSSENIKLINNELNCTKFIHSAQHDEKGISIIAGKEIRLRDNRIFGKDKQVPVASIGIQGTQGLRLCCNTMTKGYSSLLAQNMNSTFLRNSNFGSDLNCQFPATSLSQQSDGGNQWNTPLGKAYHAAAINTTMYNPYISFSLFKNKTPCANTPEWANGNITPPLQYCNTKPSSGVTNEDWFQEILPIIEGNINCNIDPECTGYIQKKGINNNESPTLEDTLSARGAFKGFAYGDATNWELAKRLYIKLLEKPYLKDGNILMDSFYTAANESNILKFAQIANQISHSSDLDIDEENQSIEIWGNIQHQEDLLSIYAASGEKYDEIKTKIAESEAIIGGNYERYQYLLETLFAKKKKRIESLLLENENIKAKNLWEANEQKVNAIYLKTFTAKQSIVSNEDAKILATIAYQCVASSGHSVLLARTLYSAWDKNANFDLENHYCGEFVIKHKTTNVVLEASRIQKNNSSTIAKDLSDIAQNISIYPNPAQDELHIDIPSIAENSNIEIQISSLAGATLAKYAWFGNGKYDISRLENGLYLCYVYENGKIIATKRITILK